MPETRTTDERQIRNDIAEHIKDLLAYIGELNATTWPLYDKIQLVIESRIEWLELQTDYLSQDECSIIQQAKSTLEEEKNRRINEILFVIQNPKSPERFRYFDFLGHLGGIRALDIVLQELLKGRKSEFYDRVCHLLTSRAFDKCYAVIPLLNALKNKQAYGREYILHGLHSALLDLCSPEIEAAAIEGILATLNDEDEVVRKAAVGALAYKEIDIHVVERLKTLITSDKSAKVRSAAVATLWCNTEKQAINDKQDIIELFINCLNDEAHNVRRVAIQVLKNIGEQEGGANIQQLLKDRRNKNK